MLYGGGGRWGNQVVVYGHAGGKRAGAVGEVLQGYKGIYEGSKEIRW